MVETNHIVNMTNKNMQRDFKSLLTSLMGSSKNHVIKFSGIFDPPFVVTLDLRCSAAFLLKIGILRFKRIRINILFFLSRKTTPCPSHTLAS